MVFLNAQAKSDSTVANYLRALAYFAIWSEQSYDESFVPAVIIARDVTDWKAFQQTVEKLKPATFNPRLVTLCAT